MTTASNIEIHRYKRKEKHYIMTNWLNCKKTVIVFDKRIHYKGVSGGEQSYPIKIHKAQHTGKTVGSTTLLVMGISE